jgi:hypothetical protein
MPFRPHGIALFICIAVASWFALRRPVRAGYRALAGAVLYPVGGVHFAVTESSGDPDTSIVATDRASGAAARLHVSSLGGMFIPWSVFLGLAWASRRCWFAPGGPGANLGAVVCAGILQLLIAAGILCPVLLLLEEPPLNHPVPEMARPFVTMTALVLGNPIGGQYLLPLFVWGGLMLVGTPHHPIGVQPVVRRSRPTREYSAGRRSGIRGRRVRGRRA